MKIIYQPYYKFTHPLKYMYSEKPRVIGNLLPKRIADNAIRDVTPIQASYNFIFGNKSAYLAEKKLFLDFKNLALNSPLFQFLKKELEDYYGEKNVDYEVIRGRGFSFCIKFDKLFIQTDYGITHETRDTYFIIRCDFNFSNNTYSKERIVGIHILRSTFFEKERIKNESQYFINSHVSSNSFSKQILKDLTNSSIDNMCTGGGENLASEIRTYFFDDSHKPKFISFVYHIKDLLQYENSGSAYVKIQSLYVRGSSSFTDYGFYDIAGIFSSYIYAINCIEEYEENEESFDDDSKTFYLFEEVCIDFFGPYYKTLTSMPAMIEKILSSLEFTINSTFEVDHIDADSIINYILYLFDFFDKIKTIYNDVDGESIYTEDSTNILSSDKWQRIYSYYSFKNSKSITVTDYRNLREDPLPVVEFESVSEVEREEKESTVLVFKNKPQHLKFISKKEDIIEDMCKKDFVLKLNPKLESNIKIHLNEHFPKLSKLAVENTLFREQEEIQTYINRRVYESSSGPMRS